MKKVFSLLLVLVLLTGCTTTPKPTTTPTTFGPTEPTVTLYDPNSDVEELTGGAVRAYPVTGSLAQGFRFVGQDLLLFTKDEHVELTTLKLLRGDDLSVVKTLTLDGVLYPTDAHLRIGEDTIGYYNQAENSIVLLDHQLNELRRIELPDDVTDTPILSADLSRLYYCVGSEIRVLELSTGISRLLKQHTCTSQSLVGIHFNDTVLEVFVTGDNGNAHVAFVSTENGQTLGTDRQLMTISSEGNSFFLRRQDGIVTETLVGKVDGQLRSLHIGQVDLIASALSVNGMLTAAADDVALYELAGGRISARVSLGEGVRITEAAVAPGGNYVWVQGHDGELNMDVLYRWDPTATEVAENTVYLFDRYSVDAPDTEGLARLQKKADELGAKYGLKLYVGTQLPESDSYEFTYEHQTVALEMCLAQLETLLDQYPEDLFRGLADVSKSGTVHIGFVREAWDNAGLRPFDLGGLHYIKNGDHYIMLETSEDITQAFHHQLCHALDSKVYSVSKAFDLWDELNPKEFVYVGEEGVAAPTPDDPNLMGETQAFVNANAMASVKEDRAFLFQYAMAEGNADLFKAPVLQKKLQQLCLGIREAYKWQKTDINLPWEQYLVQE